MNLLDHDTHQKAGRQLILISVSIILLSQCAADAKQWKILGNTINIDTNALLTGLSILQALMLVVFLMRVVQTQVGTFAFSVRLEQIKKATEHKNALRQEYSKLHNINLDRAVMDQEAAELKAKVETLIDADMSTYQAFDRTRRMITIFLFFLLEIGLPVLVFGVSFVSPELFSMICTGPN